MENLTKNDVSIGKYAGLGLFIVSLADVATFLTGAEERIALIAYGQSLCFMVVFWYMRKLLSEKNISQFADLTLVVAAILPCVFTIIDLSNPGQLTLSGDQPISTGAGGLYFSISLAFFLFFLKILLNSASFALASEIGSAAIKALASFIKALAFLLSFFFNLASAL